jgi:GAF domain-containing protein
MAQLRDKPKGATPSHYRRELMVVAFGLASLLTAWLTSGAVPKDQNQISAPGIVIFAILYAVLSLAAYRVQSSLYAGFQNTAIVAIFLSSGPASTILTAFIGSALAEIGRLAFRKWIDLPRQNLRQSVVNWLLNASASSFAVLLAGYIYVHIYIGKPLPLESISLERFPQYSVLFGMQFLLLQLPVLLTFRFETRDHDHSHRDLVAALPTLILAELLPLPLSLLLASSFVNGRTPSFLIIALGTVVAALLFHLTKRSRRALEQRVEELATLNSVGQAISSSLAQPDLLQILSDEVRRLMNPPTFYVALYAPDTQVLTFPFVIHNGVRAYWTPRLSGTGEPEYIIKTRRPLLLRGAVRAQFLDLGVQAVGPESRCFLSVPLIADGEVLGVLVAQHGQNEEAFGASEMAFLTTLSTQAAIALRNANLFKRVSEMADKLALLNNVSSVVTASLDLDSVLNTICNVVIEVGYADKTGIFLLSEDGSTLRLAYSIGLSEDYVAQFQEIAQSGDSGLFQIAQQSALMVFSDVRTDPLALGWRTLAEIEGYTAMLTVPLIANEQVIGLLAAFYQQPHTFIKSELDLMTTLANQVAVTVANARLYQDTQVRAREMMQLAEASRVFTASLDLPSVAEKVLDQLQALLAPDMIALLLANNAGENLQVLMQRGIESMEDATPVGSIRRAIAACKPMMLPEESADLAFLTQYNMVSMYAIPMVSQDKAFGVVLIGHRTVRRYHVRERQLAEALVNLAATSVRNAQLYSQTDAALADRVIELSAIEAISRNISGQLDLEGIITDVLDLALEVTQTDAAGCALVSEEAPDHLSFVERYGVGEKVTGSTQAVDRKSGIIGRVMRTGPGSCG